MYKKIICKNGQTICEDREDIGIKKAADHRGRQLNLKIKLINLIILEIRDEKEVSKHLNIRVEVS